MHSPCTPTNSILFPRMRKMTLLDLPTNSAVLAEILQKRNITKKEIEGSLVEFVIKAWKEGRKVREWCKDIQQVLEVIQVPETLRECIRSVPLTVLIPFVNLPSNAYFPTIEPPLPPPLIPTESLPNITRQQLIETLSKLSIENHEEGSRPFCDEPLIFELCLSYISTIWRSKKLEGEDNLIDWMSQDLTEVEFELQLQGEPTYTTSIIIPILHKFRFQLGFVTSSQLITRFDSFSFSQNSLLAPANPTESFTSEHSTSSHNDGGHAKQLEIILESWIDRRLSIGLGYQNIHEELGNIKSRIEDRDHKQLIDQVLEENFGFFNRDINSELSTEQSGLFWSSPSSPISSTFDTSIKADPVNLYSQLTSPSALSLLTAKMGRKRSVSHHTPRWLYHKRNNSSSSKLRSPSDHSRPTSNYLAGSGIPETSTASILTSPSTLTFTFPSTSAESRLRQSVISERPRTTFRDDLTSSLMSLTDPEDIRTVLLNQLMDMRYHLHDHEDEGWFLGGGREQAEELLTHLEKKMIGKRDLMGLKEIFVSMRSAFDLPPSIKTSTYRPHSQESSVRRDTIIETISPVRESMDLDKFLEEVAQLPDTLEENSSEENQDGHENSKHDNVNHVGGDGDVDGEAEAEDHHQYEVYKTPLSGTFSRRKSASAHSVLTMRSFLTTDSQFEETRLSCFEIQEAHREYHTKSRAVEYHFPLPPSTPPAASKTDWTRYERISTSVPDLSELEEKYTRLPPKIGSLRRTRTRISQNATELKALDLGIPFTPIYQSLALQEESQERYIEAGPADQTSSRIDPASPVSPLSPSWVSEDSPSKSSFDTHIMTPTTVRQTHPYSQAHTHPHDGPISTLSSQATLFSPHDVHFITPDRRRASLGPVDKSRRQMHRQFAIFDGEQVPPSKESKDLGIVHDTEDLNTPTLKVVTLADTSAEYESDKGEHDISTNSGCTSMRSDITPKVSTRVSNMKIVPPTQPKFSFNQSVLKRQRNVSSTSKSSSSKHASSQSFQPRSPVPLTEVLNMFRKYEESEDGLSLWEVEDVLHRVIEIEKDRNAQLGEMWDEEKKGRLRWLIEQVAIMLGDPVYVAPISRVISSLSSQPMVHSPESITLNATFPPTSPSFSYEQPRRPSLPRYKSQPQFSSSSYTYSSSPILTSPPRPEPIRPNILRRHTQACLSITSMESGSSVYSTPSINNLDPTPNQHRSVDLKYQYHYDEVEEQPVAEEEEQEEIMEFPFPCNLPLPSIGGIPLPLPLISKIAQNGQLNRENTKFRNKRLSKGYEDWDIPLPQRMEWPVPRIISKSISSTAIRERERERERQVSNSGSESSWNSIGSNGTFGRR